MLLNFCAAILKPTVKAAAESPWRDLNYKQVQNTFSACVFVCVFVRARLRVGVRMCASVRGAVFGVHHFG